MATSPLDILSSLGALKDPITGDINLVDIKPFFDWIGTSLRNTILTMRLLNAGEDEDSAMYCARFPEGVRQEKRVVETLIRSIWRFNGVALCTQEDLETFNQSNNLELSELDFKRMKIRNFEKLVRDRLYAIYVALEQKQVRALHGIAMCHVTGKTFLVTDIPEGSIRIRYSSAEIICKEAYDTLTPVEQKEIEELMRGVTHQVDVSVEQVVAQAATKPAIMTLDNTYRCRYCNKEFPSEGEVITHVETNCDRVGFPAENSGSPTSFDKVPEK